MKANFVSLLTRQLNSCHRIENELSHAVHFRCSRRLSYCRVSKAPRVGACPRGALRESESRRTVDEAHWPGIEVLVGRPQKEKKQALARYLDDQTLFDEMRRVQRELKDAPITMEEITAQVKAVRKARAARARGN
jgi:hypothetical protein